MIIFQHETQNLTKYIGFEKSKFIQQWLTKNVWYGEEIVCIFNNKLQKILFKKHFIWKNEKD